MFGAGVLHGDLDGAFGETLDLEDAVDYGGLDALAAQSVEDLGVEVEFQARVLAFQGLQLGFE